MALEACEARRHVGLFRRAACERGKQVRPACSAADFIVSSGLVLFQG